MTKGSLDDLLSLLYIPGKRGHLSREQSRMFHDEANELEARVAIVSGAI